MVNELFPGDKAGKKCSNPLEAISAGRWQCIVCVLQ